jgi:hypothetical protein
LHEDEVPDFDVAAAIAGKFAIGVAFLGGLRAHVVENLAAGAAGAGVAHGPEIVFQAGDGDDPLGGDVFLSPDIAGFFVDAQRCAGGDFGAAEDGYVELFFGEAVPLGRGD